MKLKHFGVGCFSLCARCLFTDGVLQGSDSVGFFPAIKQSAGKKQRADLRAFAYGARQKQRGWSRLSLPKSDPQK